MGSLFKLRDFWSLQLNNEDFSSSAMILSNIDNESNGALKIVLGSFQGILRILQPTSKNQSPNDVLLEKKFDEPILQVLAGSFIPGGGKRSLAILFPKRVIVATITRRAAAKGSDLNSADRIGTGADFFLQYQTHREHVFEHTAYNMVSGFFGNANASFESICVQSMDGQLTFVDHQKMLFQRFLPSTHFLVPGYLQYNPKSDSFLTSSSSLEMHSYKYFTIAQSTGSESKEGQVGRKIAPDWTFNVGEDVMDIQFCRLTRGLPQTQTDIVVLCERTLFVLKDNGELRFNKRLDMPVVCLCPFSVGDDSTQNLIVGTATENVMVYSDSSLLWSAKMSSNPITIAVGTMCDVEGMIVTLSQEGTLALNYLGTDPANNPVQPLESKDLDYDAMDDEHRRLQQVIRQAVNNTLKTEHDSVTIKVEPPSVVHFPQRACSVVIGLTLNGAGAAVNSTLITTVGEPLRVDHPTYTIESLPPNETVFITLHFHCGHDGGEPVAPTSLIAEFSLCFTSSNGQPLSCRSSVVLPYGLVAVPVPALKNPQFKVQVDTNKAPPPSLQEVFQDLAMIGEVQPNVLSVKYPNGMDATVLVSKNAGRYRVQSSSFEGLWLLTSELVRRLKLHYKSDRTEELRIDIPEPLPIEEYFMVIDTHMTMRVELRDQQDKLGRVTHQFRAIQKRLLVRFRDRNPASLASLELLFEDTYRKLHLHADAVEHANNRLKQAGSMLSSATHLMLLLMRYKHQDTFGKDDFDVFRQYMSPSVAHTVSGVGWEEITDANMTHLLRTTLSKNVRESGSSAQPLVESFDVSRVKKHLTIVFDRIAKGANLGDKALSSVEVLEGKRGNIPPPS